MPCYQTGSREGDLSMSLSEQISESTKLARMLCFLCANIEEEELESELFNVEIERWWSEHKKVDAERRAAEKESRRVAGLKKKARSKLTAAERTALGV